MSLGLLLTVDCSYYSAAVFSTTDAVHIAVYNQPVEDEETPILDPEQAIAAATKALGQVNGDTLDEDAKRRKTDTASASSASAESMQLG